MSDNRNLSEYNEEDQVRKRPAPTFGTNDEFGAANSVNEVIDNSVDEAAEGYGKRIQLEFLEDDSVIVADEGRGLPMHWNEKLNKFNWEIALCKLYGSGKYDSKQYSNSAGLNGLGLTATQYASEYMDVCSTYDNKRYIMHFKKGRPVSELQVTDATGQHSGTVIRFKPDPEVFPALNVRELPAANFINRFRELAMTLPGVEFVLKHYKYDSAFKFNYSSGAIDVLRDISENTFTKCDAVEYFDEVEGTDHPEVDTTTYKLRMKLSFIFDKKNGLLEVYHNRSHLTEPVDNPTANIVKKAFVTAFTEYGKQCGAIARSDKFVIGDIEQLIMCVAETYCPGYRTEFKHQTKTAITNPFIVNSLAVFTMTSLMDWFRKNKEAAQSVINQAVLNKTARESAEAVSKKVLAQLTKSTTGFGNKIEKFYDCKCKDVARRELYIVEGDSAGGGVKDARDGDTQAILALRGKIINCAKEQITRVLSSQIIVRLWRVLQCGLQVESDIGDKLPKFNIDKLNYDKVIICTDADVDGFHIRTLVLTAIYTLSPELIRCGKIYIVESPLYRICWGSKDNESVFVYSDTEKNEVINALVNKYGVKKSKIQTKRYKGLGECSSDMLWSSTMNPKTRKLIKIEYDESDETNARYMINSLLGDDIATRKELIKYYFAETKKIREEHSEE